MVKRNIDERDLQFKAKLRTVGNTLVKKLTPLGLLVILVDQDC